MSSGGRIPPQTDSSPGCPCRGAGPQFLHLGLPGRGAPACSPCPSLLCPTGPSSPPHPSCGALGSVPSLSPPEWTPRLWSLWPHKQLWGSLLLQPQTSSVILERACALPPCPSLVHASPQSAWAPSPGTPSCHASGRLPPSASHHLLPLAQATIGQYSH